MITKKGFLGNIGPDPLENRKATRPEFNVRPSSNETPFKWRFAGGPMMARFKWYFDHLSSQQLKNIVKIRPPLTKVSGSAHEWGVNY